MLNLIDYARADGVERLEGMVLADNRGMLGLVGRLGFAARHDPDDPGVMLTRLDLAAPPLAEPAGAT
jgi:acetyltransferase